MLELFVTVCVLTFLAYVRANQMGADGPKDPTLRVEWQSSTLLGMLKDELAACEVLDIASDRLVVRRGDGQEVALRCEDGQLLLERDGSSKVLQKLGPAGTVQFRLLSPRALFANIVADTGNGQRREVGLRLELAIPSAAFKA